MNIQSTPCSAAKWLLLCGLLTPVWSVAQAPVQAQDEAAPEDTFWLSPFEVVTAGDSGYERVSAGTATRIAMDIIETPLSIQVISEEFMKDTGRSNIVDIFDYSASIDTSPDDVMRNDAVKVRGFGVSFVLRDGFKKYYDAPLDAVDRVEVVKGPNAVFFGQSQPGGVINYITKSPLWDPAYEARVEIGDHDAYKAWADATGPLNDFMAYRVITSFRDARSWKEFTEWRNKYVFGALTVRPLKKVEIKGVYEYNDGWQEGGINTALVANEQYYRDYYANEGRDWGYAVDWSKQALPTYLGDPSFGPGVRYPWPVPLGNASAGWQNPPVTGFGGINPRWDGTVTDSLRAFFNNNVPAEFANYTPVDQGIFPEWQRGVKAPFQYPMIDLFSSGTGAAYKPGWRVMKWFESGMTSYPGRFDGAYFPNGYNANANGKGAFHDTEHHIATVELKTELTKWLNIRYAGNYLENVYLRVQQFNSDTDMDGATLAPAQGYGATTAGSPSGAAVNSFLNSRYTQQLDATVNFDTGGISHTILVSGEQRKDKFVSYTYARTPYYFDNVLRVTRRNPNGTARSYTYQEGVANYDLFSDSPPDLSLWLDLANPGVDLAVSNFLEERAVSGSYRGQFFEKKLSLLTGVRWEEREDFFYDGQSVGESRGEPLSAVTPMVGVNYELKPGLAVYASYSESFVPPGRPQPIQSVTFYEGSVENPQPRVEPVDPLGAEKGIGYETGFKASGFKGKVNGVLTVFHLERQSIVVTDSNLIEQLRANYLDYGIPWDTSLESTNAPRKNSGVQVSEGLELDTLYRPLNNLTLTASFSWLWKAELEEPDSVDYYGDINLAIGSLTGPWPHPSLFSDQVLGSYTVPSTGQVIQVMRPLSAQEMRTALTEATTSGNPAVNPYTGEELVFEPIQHKELERVSKYRLALWAKYDFTEGRLEGLSTGLGGNYQSKQRPVQVRHLEYWNPGFWTFDAMVGYDIPFKNGDMMTLQFNLNNILDERRIDSGSFGINAPRTWKLTATYKF